MIGGHDIIIPFSETLSQCATDSCLRVIRKFWPEGVYETADAPGAYVKIQYLANYCREVFVYRNLDLAHQWDELGGDESLINTMIHLLEGKERLTVVVGDANQPEMSRIVHGIRQTVAPILWRMEGDLAA